MTKIANETDEASIGGSVFNGGLGFAAHSKEHLAWVSQLKAGDKVDVLHPWFDGEVKGGRRTNSFVIDRVEHANGTKTIRIDGFGIFYLSGARFNQVLMPPNE